MLKRPNPYRKSRAAGTLDDLMFDMDKRRHTSFRFQNYQNFITDRPGKFDERYRQKLSWCALDEETGQLDYLTEGLSPKGGRRMSTSSVGSSRTGGGGGGSGGGERDHDRDSLLSNQAQQQLLQQQQQHDSGESSGSSLGGGRGSGKGGGCDDDAASTSTRGEDPAAGFLSPSRFRLPPASTSPRFMSPPIGEGGGGGGTAKAHSGRSWKAPQFAMDLDNHGPGVLLEHSPTRHGHTGLQQQRRRAAASDEAFPVSGGGTRSLSPSPAVHRHNMQWARQSPAGTGAGAGAMKNGGGPRRSISSSSSSSGRRSSNSAFSLGTGPVRGPGSWTRGGGSSRSSTSSKVSGGRVSGGGGGGGGSENQEVVVSTTAAAAGPPEQGRGRTAEREEKGCARAPQQQLTSAPEGDEAENEERGESPVQPRLEVDDEVTGVGASGGTDVCSGAAAAVAATAKPKERSWAGEDDKVGGAASTVNPGREASYGTVTSSAFCSGVGDARGSLLASFNTLPRKSLESTYFESNASVAVTVPSASGGGGGDGGGVVGGGAGEHLSASGGDTGAGRTPAAAEGQEEGAVKAAEKEEEEETQGPKKGGKSGGGGRSRGGGGMARVPGADMVVGHAVDPAALVRPPRVGDGKLEHDKERRLGVANDLEAVIAELNRRKSLLAWEDGEGAVSDPCESPARATESAGGGDVGAEKETRQEEKGEVEDEHRLSARGALQASAGSGAEKGRVDDEPVRVARVPASEDAFGERKPNETTPLAGQAVEPAAVSPAAGVLQTAVVPSYSFGGDENKPPPLTEEPSPPTNPPSPAGADAGGAGAGAAADVAVSTTMLPPSASPRGAGASLSARTLASAAAAAAATGFDSCSSSSTTAQLGLPKERVEARVDGAAAGRVGGRGWRQGRKATAPVSPRSAPTAKATRAGVSTTPTKENAGDRRVKASSAPRPTPSAGAPCSASGGGGRPRATAAMAVAGAKAGSPRTAAKSGFATAQGAGSPRSAAKSGFASAQRAGSPRTAAKSGFALAQGAGSPRSAGKPGFASAQGAGSPRSAGKPGFASAPRAAPAPAGYSAPTKSSKARVGGGGGGGGDDVGCGGGGATTAAAGYSRASPSSQQPQQLRRVGSQQRRQKERQSPRSKEEEDRRGRDRVRAPEESNVGGSRGCRRLSSSAPPPELRDGGLSSARVEGICADIITPSDLVTSAQEQVEGAPPLSGVPASSSSSTTPRPARGHHRRSTSAGMLPRSIDEGVMDPAVELADAAMTLSGVRTSGGAAEDGRARRGAVARGTARERGTGGGSFDRRSMVGGGGGGGFPA
ncbi:unnamed protein product [Ectocarpus sp. 6 AP-2014]